MAFVLAFVLTAAATLHLSSAGSDSSPAWSYDDHHGDGPAQWKNNYDKCGGSKQSPIDVSMKSTQHDSSLTDFHFTGYNTATSYAYELTNNGHTAQLNIKSGEMTITGGNLPRTFQLAQFHFHWGKTGAVGSEHTINGKSYPMEFHLVHFNKDYVNVSMAAPNANGLAVLGIFAEIGDVRHEGLEKVLKYFKDIRNAGNKVDVTAFPLEELLPTKKEEYVRYSGSLTTPPCYESVIWTVFRTPIKISETQMNEFRTLNHNAAGEPVVVLVDNYRPVQPLNGRRVTRSYTTLDPSDISGAAAVTTDKTLAAFIAVTIATLAASLF